MPLIYDSFVDCSEVLHIATSFDEFQKPVEAFQDASKMIDLQLGAPTHTHFKNLVRHDKANMVVRCVHITTRNETPRKSSATPINTCQR